MTLDIGCRYKQIDGFEDYYITEHGDVFSTRLRGNEKEKKLRKLKPKDPGRKSKYLNIILCNDHEQRTEAIHRLVAKYFVDGYFDGAVVNHIDGNNRNNDYTNLEWTDAKDNIHKSYKTSGKDQYRNVYIWTLLDSNGNVVGDFYGHQSMELFVKESRINASPTMLSKHGESNGYTIVKHKA